MTPVKYKIWFLITLAVLLMPLKIFAEEVNDIQYKFIQNNSGYSFFGTFRINANPKCLLEISFNYEHIRALAQDAKEVLLIEQGIDWNKISYTYERSLYFENRSVWHRTLNREKQRVNFILVSSENNRTVMPRIISSSGFYQIKLQEDYIIVEYYQECQLSESSLIKLYLNKVKKEAMKFMHDFLVYAKDHCGNITSSCI